MLLLILTMTITGCMSTATETSDNTYRIETIEFPHSRDTNGFEYAKNEWTRRAEKICKEKKVIGNPQYRNTNNGVTDQHSIASAGKKWIIAFGEIRCA